MKPYHFIAPALALVGSGYWLSNQNNTISELTEKTRIIRERVVVVEKASSEATASFGAPKNGQAKDEFTLADGSLDWKLIAEMMAETRGANGMPTNMKAILKLQQKMMQLSEEQLIDGLEKIDALDLDPENVEMIKQGLLSQLAEKNPKAALTALGDPITSQSNMLFWVQTQIISKLAKEDPAAAIAWMDKNIADGKLDSTTLNQHQDLRLRLESPLILQLLSSDYATAKSRLEGFSDDDKLHLLSNNHQRLKGDAAKNLIKITRESLPPDKASQAISSAFGNQHIGDLSNISKAVKDIPLTEDEKSNVLESLVSNYSLNNESESKFQDIYQWSKTEAPGKEADFVANALSSGQSRWNNPQANFEKALTVAESLGDPEILTSFVSKFSRNGNEDTIKRQVEKFNDPEVAEQYRNLAEDLAQNHTDSE